MAKYALAHVRIPQRIRVYTLCCTLTYHVIIIIIPPRVNVFAVTYYIRTRV